MNGFLRDARHVEFVKAVDLSLEFVECLKGSPTFDLVYKVKRDDTMYVLKAAKRIASHFWFLCFERNALREAVDVPGITHLVTDYGRVNGDYSAFLKEYAEGFRFSLDRIPSSYHPDLKSQLTDTIRALNENGYFGLDIVDRNLVVSHDLETITLIDAFYVSRFPSTDMDIEAVNALFS